jgi:predicted trehalose synthase
MTTTEAEPETSELPDRAGDVTVAVTPRQLASMVLIAAVILAILRRVSGRRRDKPTAPDREG